MPIKDFLTSIARHIGAGIMNASVIMGISRLKQAYESDENIANVIYEALQKNQFVMGFIASLDINAKKQLIDILSDQKFREWLIKNIDSALNYIILVIKSTMPPEPPRQESENTH